MARRDDIGFAAVARLAGVSTATVSNTLNRPEIVAETTRARVLAAIEQLEFVPNRAAATLRQGSSRLIGLVVPDIANDFYATIARGVTRAAAKEGYTVALCVSDDDFDQELGHFAHLAELRAAGALVVPLSADDSRLGRLRTVGTHLVLVDRVTSAHEGCSVAIDDVRGGEIATEHLLGSTAGTIALVNGPRGIPQCDDRRQGLQNALTAAGRSPDEMIEIEVPAMTIAAGRDAAERLLQAGLRRDTPSFNGLPAGVFCTNDQLAVGLIRGLAEHGIRVPDDVAVVGYGDLAYASESLLTLTSVRQPKEELGTVAVAQLLAEVRSEVHTHTARLFVPELVVRESAPSAR